MEAYTPEEAVYASKDYRRTRIAYTAQCATEYLIMLMVADDFLAKLLNEVGMSDAAVGLLSSLVSFTLLFQLLSIPLAARIRTVKKPVILLQNLSMLLMASVYMVPFLPLSVRGKTVAAAVLLLAAYISLYLCTSVCYLWGNSFVSPYRRGRFGARKEIISLLSGVAFVFLMSQISDHWENRGHIQTAFIIIGISMVCICAVNFTLMTLFKDMPMEGGSRFSARELLRHVLARKEFRNIMVLTATFDAAKFLTIGFMGTYKVVDLGYSLGTAQLINIAACLLRAALSQPLGRYSDRKGRDKGYFIGCLILLAAFVCGSFATPSARWLMVPYVLFYHANYAGTSANTNNLVYSAVEKEYILPAMLINNSVRGVTGFASAFVGSRILSAVQAHGNTVWGISLHGQQLLCILSALLMLVVLTFLRRVVGHQKLQLN